MIIEQKEVPHTLLKAIKGVKSKVIRKQLAGCGQAWLLEHQHEFLSSFLCIVETRFLYMVEMAKGLNITLDDLASLCR